MNLFTAEIKDWPSWAKVYHDKSAFGPLVAHILAQEGLPPCPLSDLTPGTNGVFRCGDYVVKVFAPTASGVDSSCDIKTELFATQRANRLGVAAPQLVASGLVRDRYDFYYMITRFIEGQAFTDLSKGLSADEKRRIGSGLRRITDLLNTPCADFNGIDAIHDPERWQRWSPYPESFRRQRAEYLGGHDFGPRVFVHGDINGDNLLVGGKGDLYLIDFADAVRGPLCYEHALVAGELFDFDPHLMAGFFGQMPKSAVAQLCFDGLLIHDFGGDVVRLHVAPPGEITDLAALKRRISERIDGFI